MWDLSATVPAVLSMGQKLTDLASTLLFFMVSHHKIRYVGSN